MGKPWRCKKQSRIDNVFPLKWLLNYATESIIFPAPVPDQKGVILTLDTKDQKRGPGYWKHNVSILNDCNYQTSISSLFKKHLMNIKIRLISDCYGICLKYG